MKKLVFLSAMALVLCATSVIAQTNTTRGKTYGTAFTQKAVLSPGRFAHFMKDKQKVDNYQTVGYVSEVCQKEGCWIKLRTDKKMNDDVLVKIKDHSFTVPKDIAGQRVMVNGTIVKKMQTVAEQKHYLQDAGASAAEIATITKPKEVFEIEATGIQLGY